MLYHNLLNFYILSVSLTVYIYIYIIYNIYLIYNMHDIYSMYYIWHIYNIVILEKWIMYSGFSKCLYLSLASDIPFAKLCFSPDTWKTSFSYLTLYMLLENKVGSLILHKVWRKWYENQVSRSQHLNYIFINVFSFS